MTVKQFDWKPGDRIRISFRGPCSADEMAELRRTHEEAYPGVVFEFEWDENPIEIKKKKWGLVWRRL